MKKCNKCKTYLDEALFNKSIKYSDGLYIYCKICIKKYRNEKKEHINLLRKIKYAQNADKICLKNREKYKENSNKIKEYNRKWYASHKEYFSKKNKKYSIENKEYIYLKNRKRNKKIVGNNIPQDQINILLSQHEDKCFYCKIEVKAGYNLHLDHKIPLSKDGNHTIENLVPSCKTCNLQKGTQTDEEFLKRKQ